MVCRLCKSSDPGYLVVFHNCSVGVIEELVDAPEEDEGWNVPRVDLDHLFVSVSGIHQSPAENKPGELVSSPSPSQINRTQTQFVCMRYLD